MNFRAMRVSDKTAAALDQMGYLEATEVQEKTIPLILQGEEVVIRSQTGTGKTAAFGIGIIEIIANDKYKKALILAPTRELTLQISKELRAIAKNHRMNIYAIYGGQDIYPQERMLRSGFEIVVATPGRLLDHFRRGTLKLSEFNIVILDEADRMLDMGFMEDMEKILKEVSKTRQMMLLSATIDRQVKSIANRFMQSPTLIEVGTEGKVETIAEEFVQTSRAEKYGKLKEIISNNANIRTIIFVATQRCTEFVCRRLNQDGIPARDLHGGKRQNQRERIMQAFKQGEFNILVATDVASRGLHIEDISHIINYDRANTADTHTHRIGRTGRMGKEGKAITFVETDPLPQQGFGGARGYSTNPRCRPRRTGGYAASNISMGRRPHYRK